MWEQFVGKLLTISKWDAACPYRISLQTSVVCYVWYFTDKLSSIRHQEVGHCRVMYRVYIIEGCRLSVEVANLSINN